MTTEVCPFRTAKARYRTKAMAWRDIKGDMGRPPPEGYRLRPFKCQCGKWHVSSIEFVTLRRDAGSRIWTVFTRNGLVGFHIKGPHNKGIAVEWTFRDVCQVTWGLWKGLFRARTTR